MSFTEATYESAVIQLFQGMGYTHIYAPEMGRTDYSSPLLENVLQDALVRINRGLPWAAIGIAVLSVFLVVFATMMYSMSKVKKDNPIDALKNENL